MMPEIKQSRTCQACNKVTEYDGWQVDGYGFATVVCACGAVSNYRGVIGRAVDLPDGGVRVTYTPEELAYRKAAGQEMNDASENA